MINHYFYNSSKYCKITFCSIAFICLFGSDLFAQVFSEVSAEMGITHDSRSSVLMGGGIAFVDLNNDGWEDLYMTGGDSIDRVYINNMGESFEELILPSIAETGKRVTNSVSVGDINNDGFMDLFVGSGSYEFTNDPNADPNRELNFLFLNNGDNTFTDIAPQTILQSDTAWTISSTFGDFNLDGYLDLYVGNYVHFKTSSLFDGNDNFLGFFYEGYQDKLYLNDGNLGFVEVSETYGVDNYGPTLAAAATDYNFDHIPDIYVANDFGQWNVPNLTYQNQYPEESFSNVSSECGMDLKMFGMGIAIGDIDLDGDFDYYVTNLGRNVLMVNNGNHFYEDLTTSAGVENTYSDSLLSTSWGCVFADFNNNTLVDLVVSNGVITTIDEFATNVIDPNKFFLNNGDGTFEDISDESNFNFSGINRGLAIADYDKDGDLDIAINSNLRITDDIEQPILYRNDLDNDHNWIKFALEGTFNNLDAYGAKIMIYVGDATLMREADGGSSHASSHSKIIHFGLGANTEVDSCQVIWPGGLVQKVDDYQINQTNMIVESDEETGINEIDRNSKSLRAFIDKQTLHLFLPANFGAGQVELYNLNGQLVFEVETNLTGEAAQLPINTPLSSGAYILQLSSKEKSMTTKIFTID